MSAPGGGGAGRRRGSGAAGRMIPSNPPEQCMFEAIPGGCMNANCTFYHLSHRQNNMSQFVSKIQHLSLGGGSAVRHQPQAMAMASTGPAVLLCKYDSTPTGCLKPSCKFLHQNP